MITNGLTIISEIVPTDYLATVNVLRGFLPVPVASADDSYPQVDG